MRKLITLLALLVLTTSLWSTEPTVTMTKSTVKDASNIYYEFSFATTITAADSAFVYKTISGGKPWYIGYMGTEENGENQMITLTLDTGETTADSVRQTVLWQVSFEDNANQYNVDQYATWETDVADNALFFVDSFTPSVYGRPRWLRLIIYESDTNKDANQTITGRITFPAAKRDRNVISTGGGN